MSYKNIVVEILNLISDGRIRTISDIAAQVEASYQTTRDYLITLSMRYPINIFKGGINRGGVQLDTKYIVKGKLLSNDKLQIVVKALEMLQNSNENFDNNLICDLIEHFSPPELKESQSGRNRENGFEF